MASPAVVTTAETAVSTAGTSHAITLPSGIVAGNLILIVLAKGNVASTMNAHADYTELLDESVAAAGLFIAYRWAAGGETNPTFTSSASTRSATIAYRISGAINPATQAPQVGTTATGSGTTPNPPSISPTGGSKDYLFIACCSRDGEEADDDTWATAAPTNYTNLLQKACGIAGTNLAGIVAAAQRQATTATEDPGTFTIATGGWRAQTIAIHPAVAVTHNLAGDITFDPALDGVVTRETKVAGDIALDIAVDGNIAITAPTHALAGEITFDPALDGAIGRTTSLTGDIAFNPALDVAGTRTTSLTGDLAFNPALDVAGTRTTSLTGDIALDPAVDGIVVRTTFLAGDIAQAFDLDGNPVVEGGAVTHNLAGDLALEPALDGVLGRQTSLAGDIALVFNLDGNIAIPSLTVPATVRAADTHPRANTAIDLEPSEQAARDLTGVLVRAADQTTPSQTARDLAGAVVTARDLVP